MGKRKVVKKQDVINLRDIDIAPLKDRVVEMTSSILTDIEVTLTEELEGLALDVALMIMEAERSLLCGNKNEHQADRQYNRWGTNPGSVIINGRKVFARIPRVVEQSTNRGVALKTYSFFHTAKELVKRAYRDLIRGISTRRYGEGIEQFCTGYGMSASTVSRHMVEATEAKLKELLERRLEALDIAVMLIDGVQVGGRTLIIALGVDTQGFKHILGLWQGSTENKSVVLGLVNDLLDRGLKAERPLLFVIDGSKALRSAIDEVFGDDVPVQRCTVHKKRNVLDLLPDKQRHRIKQRMNEAYGLLSFDDAREHLLKIADELDRMNPSAARSLREGLDETLTLHRLGVDGILRRSLQTTNLIESAIAVVRHHTRNVKHWKDGKQRERWIAAGLLEAEKNFKRVMGYGQMTSLVDALISLRNPKSAAA